MLLFFTKREQLPFHCPIEANKEETFVDCASFHQGEFEIIEKIQFEHFIITKWNFVGLFAPDDFHTLVLVLSLKFFLLVKC